MQESGRPAQLVGAEGREILRCARPSRRAEIAARGFAAFGVDDEVRLASS
jgi:hypothetical protein